MIELLSKTALDSTGFGSIEEGGEYNCIGDFQLGGKAESSSLLDILFKSLKGRAGFCYPVFDFCFNVHLS